MRTVRFVATGLVLAAVALAGWSTQAQAARWWKFAWTLDVTATQPRRVSVREPGAGTTLFTYITYEITNRTVRDVDIVPQVTLVTDTFKTYDNISQPDVKVLAERREGGLLLKDTEMIGPLKVGEKKRGVAIFRDVDLKARVWDLYISGLSSEYVLQLVPGQGEPLILHKEYHLQYRNVGDQIEPTDDEIRFVKEEWTYR